MSTKQKSPSNNRNNPDIKLFSRLKHGFSKEWRVVMASFLLGIMLMVIAFLAIGSYMLYSQLQLEKEKRLELEMRAVEWEQVVSRAPDYRDGHYNLAILYYQLRKRDLAMQHLNEALEIDPNFQKGLNFRGSILGE